MKKTMNVFQVGVFGIALSLLGTVVYGAKAFAAEWTYTYDVMDRVKTATDPLGRVESYSYDLAGNLTQFTDRKGQGTVLSYDPLNRVSRVQYADNSTVSLVYDTVGRLDSVMDSVSWTISFGYDLLNRVVREISDRGVISYSYDALGRRTSMTVAGYAPITYHYDAVSRLTQVTQGNQTVTIGYDAAGRRTALVYPNGTVTTYAYDSASRLTALVHALGPSTVESLSYSYDAGGNRTVVQRSQGSAASLPASASAAYDASNQQTTRNSTTPNLTYDANGNLTSWTEVSGTITYTWDARNRLVAISGPSITASFVYDVFNRRIGKTVNGVATRYLYDRYDVVAEIGGGAYSATYLRGLNIDEPFARYTGGSATSAEFYHADGIGSIVALTDLAGIVQTTYTYEPFGVTSVAGTSSANPFQFAGRENDGATGLYYLRARYYHPVAARFMQEDSIRLANLGDELSAYLIEDPAGMLGFVNLYSYVDNSPTNFTDSLGYAKGGKQKINVNLPDGRTLTKQTPVNVIQQAINQAITQGWSRNTVDSLKALRKVVSRGGTIGLALMLLDPDDANAAEAQLLCQRGITLPECESRKPKSKSER